MDTSPFFICKNKKIKGILFDLDGTLYDQKKMRLCMLYDLIIYYIARPGKLQELRIIYHFRKMRDTMTDGENLNEEQYLSVSRHLGIKQDAVKNIITRWIEERPLRFMRRCRYPYIPQLFQEIASRDLKIAIVSDYPVTKKMHALGLHADVMISSVDSDVNHFKPHPKGFLLAAKRLGLQNDECLVIGDRDDKDGLAADNAGIGIKKFLIETF
jgi:phosphoglycolate phosphatase/putative hydrolase of the HAD superfamily